MTDCIIPNAPAAVLPAFSHLVAAMNPLNPRKSTIETMIIMITTNGHKYMNNPSLAFSLQRPIYAKLC
jgi:hypothetical protein